jgi:hypothetical protein
MARRTLSNREILSQIPAARARERLARATEPRASSARYSRTTGLLTIVLTNGATIAFPARLAPGLKNASPAELAEVEVLQSGDGLSWDSLDVDLSVPGLFENMFGLRGWMSQLGRRGGKARSPAKARAARENGAKGGRPRGTRKSGRRPVAA